MATWNVTVQSFDYIPALSLLTPEFGRRLNDAQDKIELTEMESLVAHNHLVNLFLAIEVEGAEEAKQRALGWVEEVCKGASEWRNESEVVFEDEAADDYDAEIFEIGQVFAVTSVVNAETGEEAAA